MNAATLNAPVSAPAGCTQRYKDGWDYGSWWVSTGGNLNADACSNWHEEKAIGFWDRLAEARATRRIADLPSSPQA